MTLTEFLLDRIAEDERSLPCINCRRPVEPDGPRELGEFGHVAAADPRSDFWDNVCPDPTPVPRALAECEAKRRIVEMFEDECKRRDIYNRAYDNGQLTTNQDLRSRLASNAHCRGLEEAMLALAQVYADHSDFREEWRP